MAAAATFEIKGLSAMVKRLDSLPDKLRKSAETAVLRAGGAPIRKAAKSKAASSKDTGLLIKSIGLSIKGKPGQRTVRVGPRKGMRKEVTRTDERTGKKYKTISDPNNYSHLVEYGTSHSAAKPFIRPAIDASQGEVLDAMSSGLDKHLTRVAAKLKR